LRIINEFKILSGDTLFHHKGGESENGKVEGSSSETGTSVSMKLNNQISRAAKEVFDQFTSGEYRAFSKTIVPVRLAQYEREILMPCSQAED